MGLGLKGSTIDKQFDNRIKYVNEMETFEFHLVDTDFTRLGLVNLRNKIEFLKSFGINVVLHQPMTYKGFPMELRECEQTNSSVKEFIDYSTKVMVELCKEYDLKIVAHWHYTDPQMGWTKEQVLEFIDSYDYRKDIQDLIYHGQQFVLKYGQEYLCMENALFTTSVYDMKGIFVDELKKDTIMNLTFDVSHAFVSLKGDNDMLYQAIDTINHKIKHFHLVDSMGESEHDALILGKGKVDWKRIKPLIHKEDRTYIYEVGLKDFEYCQEMLDSHAYYNSIK